MFRIKLNFSTGFIFWALVLSCLLGVLLPLVTILMKLAAEDFAAWKIALTQFPDLAALISKYPTLELSQNLHFLSDISWLDSHRPTAMFWYARYAIFSLLSLVLLFSFRSKINSVLNLSIRWANQQDYSYARKLIFFAVLFIFVTYQAKIYWGFFFPGISGWTYTSWASNISENPPENCDELAVQPHFLKYAIVEKNLKYLKTTGFLSGKAMFLHFTDGQVLPANYELTEFVFPQYIFGKLYMEVKGPQVFRQVISHSLDRRRKGRAFLLPKTLAYPNHTPYMPIEYSGYPPSKNLEKLSFWEINLKLNSQGFIRIHCARMLWEEIGS